MFHNITDVYLLIRHRCIIYCDLLACFKATILEFSQREESFQKCRKWHEINMHTTSIDDEHKDLFRALKASRRIFLCAHSNEKHLLRGKKCFSKKRSFLCFDKETVEAEEFLSNIFFEWKNLICSRWTNNGTSKSLCIDSAKGNKNLIISESFSSLPFFSLISLARLYSPDSTCLIIVVYWIVKYLSPVMIN